MILQYAFGIPRALDLISNKETSEMEDRASPLKPRVSVPVPARATRSIFDVAVHVKQRSKY